MSAVPRVQRGRPQGGEFAEHSRTEATVELVDEADDWVPDPNHGRVFVIPAENIAAAKAKIEKANRRLERAGVTDRFDAEFETEVKTIDGRDFKFYRTTLNEPRLSFAGWTFTGAHQTTPDGQVISYGESTLEVEDMHCDHCGKLRNRGSVYTVHSDTEGSLQIGKSCLTAFLGIKPEGLWALENPLEFDELEEPDDPEWSPRASSQVFDAEELLVAALVASADGADFVSRSRATGKDPATADLTVRDFEMLMTGDSAERRAEARKVLAWVTAIPENETDDYLSNLRKAIGGEQRIVGVKHVALALSAISAMGYEERRVESERARAERDKDKVRAYLAPPKAKLESLGATVVSTHYIDGYAYGTTNTIVKLRGDDGHTVVWFASGVKSYEKGKRVKVKATVKANEEYGDEFQTVITRAKITDAETGELLGD